jgi:hypothetical protein
MVRVAPSLIVCVSLDRCLSLYPCTVCPSSINGFWYIQTFLPYTIHNFKRSRRGRDRMVVGSTTTYAISAYHH